MIFLSIFQTFTDLVFIVKLIVFVYLLYWLFITFRENQIVLGLFSIAAAYFLFFHSVSLVVFVLLFFAFVVMGMHFQFIIDMGVLPILGWFGFHDAQMGDTDQIKMQEIQKKLMDGHALSSEETELFKKVNSKNQKYEEQAQRLLVGGYQHR
ncbi:hypothetical protein HY571_02600 [Candidatus Micrarchaeota archaeon]|nr:hypothetical protein [Candidatus Micrarchaeota archaeon]